MRILSGFLAFLSLFPMIAIVFFGIWDIHLETPYWEVLPDVGILLILLFLSAIIATFGTLAWTRPILFHVFYALGLAQLVVALLSWKSTNTAFSHDEDVFRLLDWGSRENFTVLQHLVTINFTMFTGTAFIVFALFSDALAFKTTAR